MHRPSDRASGSRPTRVLLALLALGGAALPAQQPRAAPEAGLTLDQVLEIGRRWRPRMPPLAWLPDGGLLLQQQLRPGIHPDLPQWSRLRAEFRPAPEPLLTRAELVAALQAAGVDVGPETGLPPGDVVPGPFDDAEPRGFSVRLRLGDSVARVDVERLLSPAPDAPEAEIVAARATAVRVLGLPPGATAVSVTPPGAQHTRAAAVVSHQLHVVDDRGHRRQLTWDGSPSIEYGGAAHRAEFGIEGGLFWDRSGRYLAFYREDLRPIAPYPYADETRDSPEALQGRYPFAGRADSRVQVLVYDSADQSVRPLRLEDDGDQDLYWTNVSFDHTGEHVTVALVNRGQDHLRLARFVTATGALDRILLEERDAEWIEPERPAWHLENGDFVWRSPRAGFQQLYLYAPDGSLRGALTEGAFDVEGIVDVFDDQIVFEATGDDPRQRHVFAAPLPPDPARQRRLTDERGTWSVAAVDRGASTRLLLRHEAMGRGERLVIHDLDHATDARLTTSADPFRSEPFAGHMGQEEFVDLEVDGGTTLHGHVITPPDLDPEGSYPLLLYVYGGPHAQLVRDCWHGGADLWLHYMAATEGFVVARIDNRGTPHRGQAFEQGIHRRLGELEVEDQVAFVRHLLATRPYLDPERVGVHGWSFGGYLTLRLMTRAPELFAAGVSGAPVTDWALYETGYTERYMDTPEENGDGYRRSSVLDEIGRLQGRLLLVQGTDDRTVMWAHSMRLLDAAIDAGVDLDFFAYPMQKHGLEGADERHFYRKMTAFFRRELGR